MAAKAGAAKLAAVSSAEARFEMVMEILVE
jgi:hypothetical protein